jgi:hypothetical protein
MVVLMTVKVLSCIVFYFETSFSNKYKGTLLLRNLASSPIPGEPFLRRGVLGGGHRSHVCSEGRYREMVESNGGFASRVLPSVIFTNPHFFKTIDPKDFTTFLAMAHNIDNNAGHISSCDGERLMVIHNLLTVCYIVNYISIKSLIFFLCSEYGKLTYYLLEQKLV